MYSICYQNETFMLWNSLCSSRKSYTQSFLHMSKTKIYIKEIFRIIMSAADSFGLFMFGLSSIIFGLGIVYLFGSFGTIGWVLAGVGGIALYFSRRK